MAERVTRRVVTDDTVIRVTGDELGELIGQLGAFDDDEELVDIFVQVPGEDGTSFNLSLIGDVDLMVSVRRTHKSDYTKQHVYLLEDQGGDAEN
jgi:hypothetical protein